MGTFEKEMSVRGCNIYKATWEAVVGEELECRRERSNRVDQYAVAVVKDDKVVGHVPQKISRLCSLFIRRGGSMHYLSSYWSKDVHHRLISGNSMLAAFHW